jgi:hypothetical protein
MKHSLFLNPGANDPGLGSGDTDQATATASADTSTSKDNSSSNDDQSTNTSETNSSDQDQSSSNSPGTTTIQDSTGSDTDAEGFKLLSAGNWNGNTTIKFQGGQVMHFQVKNVNVLGTTLSINSNLGGNKSSLILPQQTSDLRFNCFGSEPMGWSFDVSTNSDAFIVAWKLYSSWLPGDPPNN